MRDLAAALPKPRQEVVAVIVGALHEVIFGFRHGGSRRRGRRGQELEATETSLHLELFVAWCLIVLPPQGSTIVTLHRHTLNTKFSSTTLASNLCLYTCSILLANPQ